MNIVFLQSRPSKGGAQHALKRLIEILAKDVDMDIVLVVSASGWLTESLVRLDLLRLEIIVEPFPSARSILGRLFKTFIWAKRVESRLKSLEFHPDIIQANDYIENLHGLSLGKVFPLAETSVFLRSATMSKSDFFKYQCHQANIQITVSQFMKNKLFFYARHVEMIHDGLLLDEFYPPKPLAKQCPAKILIIGNPNPLKGWGTAISALRQIEDQIPELVSAHFSGIVSREEYEALLAGKPSVQRIDLVFEQKFDNLALAARQFDLVISPSSFESFGLANLEVLAAGVPLLSSQTGIMTDGILPSDFLFEPNNVEELASKILKIYEQWSNLSYNSESIRQQVKQDFSILNCVDDLVQIYKANE